MAGAPYRLVTLPDGTRRNMPSSQVNDYVNNTFLPNQSFQGSASQPIPGLTGPVGNGAQIPGLLGGNLQQPTQGQTPSPMQRMPMMPNGPYGGQAMALAGLLGRSQIPQQPGMTQSQGLLANPSYTRMLGRIYGK